MQSCRPLHVHRLVLVEIVVAKYRFLGRSSQYVLLKLDGFCVVPPNIINMIVVKILPFDIRHKVWSHSLIFESLPVKVSEPRMIFDFITATDTHSLSRLSFKTLVDKVGSLFWISLWKVSVFDVGLFLPNSISNCFSIFTTIRSLAHHTFVPNDSHSKVINSMAVILFEHYFGSHVSWCTTILLTVFRLPILGDAEISKTQVATGIKDKVLRFDISMNNTLIMYGFKSLD